MPSLNHVLLKIPAITQAPTGVKQILTLARHRDGISKAVLANRSARLSLLKGRFSSEAMRSFNTAKQLHKVNLKNPCSQVHAVNASCAAHTDKQLSKAFHDLSTMLKDRSGRVSIGLGGTFLATLALSSELGSEENYFEYRFTTDKDPDDLAAFYGSEDFMDLFCVVPFVGTVMMRGGEFDDAGCFHTSGIPGKLSVTMLFSDEQDPESGKTLWFNKRERFKDTFGNFMVWDTVMNFGFRQLPNGKTECYHSGEYFHGAVAPFSLAVKLLFQVHARWVAWATEHHLNNQTFTVGNDDAVAREVDSRKDMPLHLIKDHFFTDLKAFTKSLIQATGLRNKKGTNESDKCESCCDIVSSKMRTRRTLTDRTTSDCAAPKPSFLLLKQQDQAGSVLHNMPIRNQLPMEKIQSDFEKDKKLQHHVQLSEDDFGYRHLGGNQTWELLRSTNNPKVYQKVTRAAIQRHETRRQIEAAQRLRSPATSKK